MADQFAKHLENAAVEILDGERYLNQQFKQVPLFSCRLYGELLWEGSQFDGISEFRLPNDVLETLNARVPHPLQYITLARFCLLPLTIYCRVDVLADLHILNVYLGRSDCEVTVNLKGGLFHGVD